MWQGCALCLPVKDRVASTFDACSAAVFPNAAAAAGRPCPLLVQYVDAGWLGKKSKRGVYEYS